MFPFGDKCEHPICDLCVCVCEAAPHMTCLSWFEVTDALHGTRQEVTAVLLSSFQYAGISSAVPKCFLRFMIRPSSQKKSETSQAVLLQNSSACFRGADIVHFHPALA